MENPIRDVLKLAVENKASDIHIKTASPVTLRMSGNLVESDFVTDEKCLSQILSCMLSEEQRKKYNIAGDVDLSYVEPEVGRFRVNIHKQRGSATLAMRHVKSQILDFKSLGLPPQIQKLTTLERGIVFITGTTGSGKSTTLASVIDYINQTRKMHIITIEDPIEFEFKDKESFIEQREVGLDTISFDSAFIHSLRQDPDIIIVGEMRSKDSFDAALKAADTGHLVFSTLHTRNAAQSINRLLDFYQSSEHSAIRQALAASLAGIVSQRLLTNAKGDGIVPAVEILYNSPIIQSLLRENKLDKLNAAIEGSREEGMLSFNQCLVDLVNRGLVTEDEAFAASDNAESLKMNLKGVFLGVENKILG
ncbi:MAG TPA: twitching motility protein [Lentisphaeria bacterium]|nr:MAG: hypothetical protein A2X47_13590 [Lentisphaerae bacterium GWF2_38_69]HBM16502.1 twitching motility protein [Lentisphaeria bacterium]